MPGSARWDDPAERLDLTIAPCPRETQGGQARLRSIDVVARDEHCAASTAADVAVRTESPHRIQLPISHIPGPPTEMYWSDAHVDEIYPGFELRMTARDSM